MAAFVEPVEITPATINAWVDVDCSAHIPPTATGIIFHVVNKALTNQACGWRKNGSTDNRTATAHQINVDEDAQFWACVGVDSARIAEFYIGNATDIDIFLVGYYTTDATFLDNAIDKTPGTTGSYQTVNVSADTGAQTAIAAIFDVAGDSAAASATMAYRMTGSTDDIVRESINHLQIIVPLDGAETCQVKIADLTNKLWLMGWITSHFVTTTNRVDMSLATTGAWTDLAALPSDAIGVVMHCADTANAERYGLRKKGSTENLTYEMSTRHATAIVECNSAQLVEGYASAVGVDFFRIGYFQAVSSGVPVKAQYYAQSRG